MSIKKQTYLVIATVIFIMFITISLTYAYFTANLTGTEESTTITVTGGTINIHYSGGADINISNIIPDDNPAAIKNFTVTGNNTTDIEMAYEISLVVEENTFSDSALKYKLTSLNTDNNGDVANQINELTSIEAGASIIDLGVGYFESPTLGNKIHTYNLEIYFPNAAYNQNIDQGKNIKAYIEIKNAVKPLPLLTDLILSQDGGVDVILSKGTPSFSMINGISGIYASVDDYGTSYYYRGIKTELNNNLIWGGFQWKIIRINGDGSIKLIYNGICENNNCLINDIGESTQIDENAFNIEYKDNKYIGYMYGGLEELSNTYEEAVTNETSSTIKQTIDSWYQTNLLGSIYEDDLSDNLFCNDREVDPEYHTGLGYGTNRTQYSGRSRLIIDEIPTLKCKNKNDRFTVTDIEIGNGALTYPVGLITADEAMFAGMVGQINNLENYLYTGIRNWTMTPSVFHLYSTGGADLLRIHVYGYIENAHANYVSGIRPVVNLKSDVKVIGDGSTSNPFIIT